MEVTKRKYTKKNNEGKITVNYYLNTRLKPVINPKFAPDLKDRFPIYIRVMVARQTIEIKSKIDFPLGLDEFDYFLQEEKEIFDKERKRIEGIIRASKPFENQYFKLKEVSLIYNNVSIPLNEAIENSLVKKVYLVVDEIAKQEEIEFQEARKKGLSLNDDEGKELPFYDAVKNNIRKYPRIYGELIKTLNWKNTADGLLHFLLIYSLTTNEMIYEKFVSLQNEYLGLWNFKIMYDKVLSKCDFLEPTATDWFEDNSIQKIIREVEEYSGEKIIQSIDKLLGENPFNRL